MYQEACPLSLEPPQDNYQIVQEVTTRYQAHDCREMCVGVYWVIGDVGIKEHVHCDRDLQE